MSKAWIIKEILNYMEEHWIEIIIINRTSVEVVDKVTRDSILFAPIEETDDILTVLTCLEIDYKFEI